MDFYSEALRAVIAGKVKTKEELRLLKHKLCKKYHLDRMPSDADILEHAGKNRKKVISILRSKPMRTLSGVSVVAVMTEPSRCPHGKCLYCVGGKDIDTPQAYSGREPAAMRASQYKFDAFTQATERIKQLDAIGHDTTKIELIVMGGTLLAQPKSYQESFIKSCFDAMNGKNEKMLALAQKRNERAQHRCVGLTIETRPDWCFEPQIDNCLSYGATRIELGVQNPDDKIYKLVERGHTVADVAKATQLCKDSALKVCYHIMPNLPGSSIKKDLKMFERLFEDERFKPDMLKIYPCLLLDKKFGQDKLWKMYEQGKWVPYAEEDLIGLLARASAKFPKYVRVMRIQRDIPSTLVVGGAKHTNLQQMVDKRTHELGLGCGCIRCREVRGRQFKNPELLRYDYKASEGKEVFLSFEDKEQDMLLGFLRLRMPAEPFRPEISNNAALVRELHIYGQALPLGIHSSAAAQHRGFGEKLLKEAETIARKEFGANKLLVMSGIGVREYYHKLGFRDDGAYVSKLL